MISHVVSAAAVLLLGLGASACGGSDAQELENRPLVDELTAHDGRVCPDRLADADAATHGLGTSAPAPESPDLAAADAGWVCVYAALDDGPADGGGTTYRWNLRGPSVEVTPAELRGMQKRVDGLSPATKNQPCTADLGPRLVLVLGHDNDLTGIVVDDFGCRDIRLSDDLYETVPGEAEQSGTVPGVLRGSTGWIDDLELISNRS